MNAARPGSVHNYDELRRLAKRRLPKIAYDFIEGGADGEEGLDRNFQGFSRYIETNPAARGKYTVVRTLPMENDSRISYRIKSMAENFERIAEEHQLSESEA